MDTETIEGMGKKERRQHAILEYLERNQYISIQDITALFTVTTQTARRDLKVLEAQGTVRRLHGGATFSRTVNPSTLRRRRVDSVVAKESIANRVAMLVPNGAAVFIDTGTTCEAVARELLRHENLRIVTYSVRIANLLSENTDFAVAIPGGFVRPVDGGVFREETGAFIRRFKFDLAVISVSGIDRFGDLGDDDHAEVAAVSSAMEQSEQVILAIDSSKFSRRGLVRLASISDMDIVVTDKNFPINFDFDKYSFDLIITNMNYTK